MGLKIRRLKTGFAYYAEYKFGKHCIYEKIEASTAREAKRIYAARYKELRLSVPRESRSTSARESRDQQIATALNVVIRKLIAKRILSESEAVELLPEFVSLNPPDPDMLDVFDAPRPLAAARRN
jgi:hypothetical protein